MDESDRVAKAYERLIKIGRDNISNCKIGEQIIYYVISTRCEIDIGGFDSVYEQSLNPTELKILINGLQQIDEPELAAEFEQGLELLQTAGFYSHMIWQKLAPSVQKKIKTIGKRVDDRLWDLDEKLDKLLDSKAK